MAGKAEPTIDDMIVVGHEWTRDGLYAVTISWAPGRRCTYSIPAEAYNEHTVRDLRAATLDRLKKGFIA